MYVCPICSAQIDANTDICHKCGNKVVVPSKVISQIQNSNGFSEKKFISDLYACEKVKYILEQRIEELEEQYYRADNLNSFSCSSFEGSSYYKKYQKEFKKQEQYPKKPKLINPSIAVNVITFGGVGAFAGGIIGIISAVVNFFSWGWNTDFSYIGTAFGMFVKDIIIFAVIGAVIAVIKIMIEKSMDKSANDAYKAQCDAINIKNQKATEFNKQRKTYYKAEYDKWRIKQKKEYDDYAAKRKVEIKQKQDLINTEKEIAKVQLSKVDATLSELYSFRLNDILCIHPNYHGLNAISILFGYFDTGRVSTLTGFEGAYNLYEQELRAGIIIDNLQNINNAINTLNATMYYVEQAVKQCRTELVQLNKNMEREMEHMSDLHKNLQYSIQDMKESINANISSSSSDITQQLENANYYNKINAEMNTFSAYYSVFRGIR